MKERGERPPGIFAIVDIETTGTRPLYDRIIDLAVIRVENGKITRKINTLINPNVPIQESIISLSGITNEMVLTAPMFEDIALELKEILDSAVFVAHNAHFDYGFIKSEFRRIGIDFKMPMLCTVKLSRALFPKAKNHDLDALISRHGIICDCRHRAYPDAKVVFDWIRALTSSDPKRIEDEIQKLVHADTLPPLLNRSVLKNLPDTSGIYFFYGKDRELLYVGKSKNIRTRVRSHFSGISSRKEHKLCLETAHVEAKETTGELSALLLEAETIKTHMPLYNRALRRARNIVVAIEEKNDRGYLTLKLNQVSLIPEDAKVASIFRTMSQAKVKLREIAKENELCAKLLGIENTLGQCFGSHIGRCNGACVYKEDVQEYNERFTKVFRAREIKSWPYKGPIVIEEKGEREGVGAMFFIDNWRLIKSVVYDHGDVQDFISSSTFDYDTYKILARYILNRANRRTIKELTHRELNAAISVADNSYESVIRYS